MPSRVLVALVVLGAATPLSGCLSSGLEARRDQAVALAKAAGLIDHRLPANSIRIESSGDWIAIDQPGVAHNDDRCNPYSKKLTVIFQRIAGRWRIAAVRRDDQFGSFGTCRVDGVPASVLLPICPLPRGMQYK